MERSEHVRREDGASNKGVMKMCSVEDMVSEAKVEVVWACQEEGGGGPCTQMSCGGRGRREVTSWKTVCGGRHEKVEHQRERESIRSSNVGETHSPSILIRESKDIKQEEEEEVRVVVRGVIKQSILMEYK